MKRTLTALLLLTPAIFFLQCKREKEQVSSCYVQVPSSFRIQHVDTVIHFYRITQGGKTSITAAEAGQAFGDSDIEQTLIQGLSPEQGGDSLSSAWEIHFTEADKMVLKETNPLWFPLADTLTYRCTNDRITGRSTNQGDMLLWPHYTVDRDGGLLYETSFFGFSSADGGALAGYGLAEHRQPGEIADRIIAGQQIPAGEYLILVWLKAVYQPM